MANMRLPAYTRRKRLAGGKWSYYWELPGWAKPPAVRHGRTCPVESTPLGTNAGDAFDKADALNEAFLEWRKGDMGTQLKPQSIAWLFDWYRQQDRFTSKSAKTRQDYRKLMDMLVDLEPKAGHPKLGRRMASKVDAATADTIYAKLRPKGERQATYAMQVCRLVWTWAARYARTTGVKENPFRGMGLSSTAAKGNRETSRAEYELYKETARQLGYQSMATAAALAFECCQRVWDVFGLKDPESGQETPGLLWENYRPGETIRLVQSKTGNLVSLELATIMNVEGAPEIVRLYPELEEELGRQRAEILAKCEKSGREELDLSGPIVVEERNGQPYKHRRMATVHREICEAAGLPRDMTFTGFRHGGITEIGDTGEADVRAISGHKTLAVTTIYNKANAEKGRRIALKRREHIARLGGKGEE